MRQTVEWWHVVIFCSICFSYAVVAEYAYMRRMKIELEKEEEEKRSEHE